MDAFEKNLHFTSQKENTFAKSLIDVFSQRETINQDLQKFWLKLFHLENAIKKSWLENVLEKNSMDDDAFRCFLNLNSFIDGYNLDELKHMVSFYKEQRLESESSLIHLNKIKREQIDFLKKNLQYLLRDMKYLKEKITTDSLVSIRNHVFSSPWKSWILDTQKVDMMLFLREFSVRLNAISDLMNKIYALWSNETKAKLDEYKKHKDYL